MDSSFKTMNKVCAAALLTAALLGSVPEALAQSNSLAVTTAQKPYGRCPQVNTVAAQRPMRRYNGGQDYMYQTLELKAPVSVPFLPAYGRSGSSYTGGVYYPRLKARQCYVMRYLAKEPGHEVMQTFRESLMQNGWQINDMQTNAKQLTAMKRNSGLFLTLCAFPSYKAGYKSSFEIKYLSAGAVQLQ